MTSSKIQLFYLLFLQSEALRMPSTLLHRIQIRIEEVTISLVSQIRSYSFEKPLLFIRNGI